MRTDPGNFPVADRETGDGSRRDGLTPLVTSSPNVPGTAWLLGESWTKDGRFAFAATSWLVCRRAA